MKVLKILGITVLVLVVGFMLIGVFTPDGNHPSREASAAAPTPTQATADPSTTTPTQLARPPDQCLEGICIGAAPGELLKLKLKWLEWDAVSDNQLNDIQKQLLDQEDAFLLEKCAPRQAATWGGKAEKVCKMLSHGDRSFKPAQFRPIQTLEVLRFFDGDAPSTCSAFKEPFEISGHVGTLEHSTQVKLRFDNSGKLRVYGIGKTFKSDGEAMSKTLIEKLNAKHPYLAPRANPIPGEDAEFEGSAPWGGLIQMRIFRDGRPSITMTGNEAEFNATQQPVCNVAKVISVQ